jgi:hypothetical protein
MNWLSKAQPLKWGARAGIFGAIPYLQATKKGPFEESKPFQPDSNQPIYNEFDRAKESATNLITGRQALAGRGIQARLGSQGLSGVPGIQTAASLPGQYQASEQLSNVSTQLDLSRMSALERKHRLDVAMKQYHDEKDAAKKARWGAIISKLAGVAVSIAFPPAAPFVLGADALAPANPIGGTSDLGNGFA